MEIDDALSGGRKDGLPYLLPVQYGHAKIKIHCPQSHHILDLVSGIQREVQLLCQIACHGNGQMRIRNDADYFLTVVDKPL